MLVAVQLFALGLYLPPVFTPIPPLDSAPDNHFTAGPYGCVPVSGSGCVARAGRRPTVRAGIVSAPGVQRLLLLPHPPQTIIWLPVHTAV